MKSFPVDLNGNGVIVPIILFPCAIVLLRLVIALILRIVNLILTVYIFCIGRRSCVVPPEWSLLFALTVT